MDGIVGFIILIVIIMLFIRMGKKHRQRNLIALGIFQYEIKRLHVEGKISQERYDELLRKSHVLQLELLQHQGYRRNTTLWRASREEAWRLMRLELNTTGAAPWNEVPQQDAESEAPTTVAEPVIEEKPIATASKAMTQSRQDVAQVELDRAKEREAQQEKELAELALKLEKSIEEESKPEPRKEDSWAESHTEPKVEKQKDFALKPKEPSALEIWLKKTAGVPALMAPFLMQNIGWFVGGFLFLAGTVFLVLYTSGFAKAFVVFLALFAYSIFLLWAAYQLRKKRPELTISSRVLAILAVMLIPLTLAADVRLIEASAGSLPLGILAVALGALGMVLFWIYANVVSGVIHNSLKGGHPKLFLILSSIQYATVPLNLFPSVYLLAFFQLSILALLAWSVRRFAQEWLKSIFDDHEHISYYAMGTLLYAALISFVHINLSEVEVITAYYGPFLMTVGLLAAYIDVQFKQWRHRYVALSRFNFVIYGLTGVALFLSFEADWALSISLVLGMVIFAWIAYQHLSTPPMVIFLAMAAWLYYVNILKNFNSDLHLLLALPGLISLFWVSHWLGGRKLKLSYHLYLITGGLMLLLLVISIASGNANWLNFVSCLSAFAISYYLLRHFPLWDHEAKTLELKDQRNSNWNYLALALLGLSLVFFPTQNNWQSQEQWIALFFLLAMLCSFYALFLWRYEQAPHLQIQTLCNFSLLLMSFNLALASVMHPDFLIFAAFSAGLLVMVLALGLFSTSLVYVSMALLMLGIFTFRSLYLPGPRSGLGPICLGLGSWLLLWWLNRRGIEVSEVKSRQVIYLLGFYKVKGPQ